MKRTIALLLILAAMLSLAACGATSPDGPATEPTGSVEEILGQIDALFSSFTTDGTDILALAKPLAEDGNADAMYYMGYLYFLGDEFFREIPKDYDIALEWFQKGAQLEHVHCMRMLASTYSLTDQPELAREWYEKGAALGDKECMAELAHWYRKKQDFEQAAQWYEQACEKDPFYFADFGSMYEFDLKDRERAAACYQKAVEAGFDFAQENLDRVK